MSVHKLLLYRGIGHPWTAEPGWDALHIRADTLDELRPKIAEAESKWWKTWFLSESTIRVHMFKPSGASAPWEDVLWQGTPRGHGHGFKIGDEVYTDFASTLSRRRVTRHRITEIAMNPAQGWSQTGVKFRVTPAVPGSSYISDRTESAQGNAWFDAAWFRLTEE